ncbi:lamin tail domain-containing protein [Cognatilysobacter terrigena]|uniref:lamin tail domain-containing protein n=1 Tax=Cognatilysobacter terrigena TaxID=2488749 RepID=UPI0010607868|nr:lamin tail domain-containing protein [Lysobacter terrigena]
MERSSRRLAALGFGLAALIVGPANAQVVISQVYGGGGNSGAPYKSDFIELHNTGASAVDVSTWSVQYASSTGTSWQKTNLSGSIPAGAYYLVKEADGAGTQPALPTPDATGTIAMSGTAGKVALVTNNAVLPAGCPVGAADVVAFGSGSTCAEGSGPTPAPSNTLSVIRTDDCVDGNNNATDFATGAPNPRNRASASHLCGGTQILASIDDASVNEGNAGTRTLVFTVKLSQAAGASGVQFTWSTADGTASAGSDYVAVSNAAATIPAGSDRTTLSVTVDGDDAIENDETLHVVLSGLTGATAGDVDGLGTIVNDDFQIIPISQVQGAGAQSPLVGQVVATRGIVTGRTSKGFFLQSRDVDADTDPNTSEGVFVFTNSAPPASAAVGHWVVARGTVQEYVPSTDPGQQPYTEIGGAIVVAPVDDATYPLPTPVELTTMFPSPNGGLEQMERVESMRVIVHDFVATAPSDGFINEAQATGSSNGLFYGTVAGVPRPFREPGIQAPDAPPAGTIPPIPQWDFNPEVMSVDSDALGGTQLDLAAGAHVADVAGPLNYSFRRWQILPDSIGAVTPGPAPRAAKEAPADAVSVAGYNMERFFDDVDDAGKSDVKLTAAALERRLSKASLGIRDSLRTPDILGVVEMENLSVLQRVADRVNNDAVAAGQPNPNYVPYLVEGNDVGGIDVGFLVKTGEAAAGTPRVEVVDVQQIGKDTTFIAPDGSTSLLNDRPPLALKAVVHYADGRTFPINVVIAHQRSLSGAEAATPDGDRIRSKRQRQAEFLAAYLDARQHEAPDTRLVVLGDFNAFEFNDGFTDSMGTTIGAPPRDEETAVYGDGDDLVEPNLVNLTTVEPQDERYSFSFDGNAQSLDHVLVNEDLVVATRDIQVDHARINADFPETNRNDANSPSRLSDHDPVVAYFVPRRRADLVVTAQAAAFVPGQPMRFDVTLHDNGPEQADFPEIGFELDAELPDLAVTAPAGWNCDASVVTAGHTSVDCRADALAANADAAFALSAQPTTALRGRPLLLVASADARSLDPDTSNNAAAAQLSITQKADLATTLAGLPVAVGGRPVLYAISVANLGPDTAVVPTLTVTGNVPAAAATMTPAAGWTCNVADVATGFRATCSSATQAARSLRGFGLRLVAPMRADQTQLVLRAEVTAASLDPAKANDASTATVKVVGSPH